MRILFFVSLILFTLDVSSREGKYLDYEPPVLVKQGSNSMQGTRCRHSPNPCYGSRRLLAAYKINEEGRVVEAHVEEITVSNPQYVSRFKKRLKKRRYKPAKVEGVPVKISVFERVLLNTGDFSRYIIDLPHSLKTSKRTGGYKYLDEFTEYEDFVRITINLDGNEVKAASLLELDSKMLLANSGIARIYKDIHLESLFLDEVTIIDFGISSLIQTSGEIEKSEQHRYLPLHISTRCRKSGVYEFRQSGPVCKKTVSPRSQFISPPLISTKADLSETFIGIDKYFFRNFDLSIYSKNHGKSLQLLSYLHRSSDYDTYEKAKKLLVKSVEEITENSFTTPAKLLMPEGHKYTEGRWNTRIVSDSFYLTDVKGVISDSYLLCEGANKKLDFSLESLDSLKWSILPDWGMCFLRVIGEPQTTFNLVQSISDKNKLLSQIPAFEKKERNHSENQVFDKTAPFKDDKPQVETVSAVVPKPMEAKPEPVVQPEITPEPKVEEVIEPPIEVESVSPVEPEIIQEPITEPEPTPEPEPTFDDLVRQAREGDLISQKTIADRYENGDGVPEDYVMAYVWWNVASAGDDTEAKKRKRRLVKKMTKEQIAEAQTLSRTVWNELKKAPDN